MDTSRRNRSAVIASTSRVGDRPAADEALGGPPGGSAVFAAGSCAYLGSAGHGAVRVIQSDESIRGARPDPARVNASGRGRLSGPRCHSESSS
jgi:hypothetical protein